MNMDEAASSALAIAGRDKAYGRDFLKAFGIPVAPGFLALDVETAVRRAMELGFPVVLKRLSGGNSEGVIIGIRDPKDCREAATTLLNGNTFILVEKMVRGYEFRLHFDGGKLRSVFFVKPQTVVGDGKSSLMTLLARRHPGYHRTVTAADCYTSRLVFRLWNFGVRSLSDLRMFIPPAGNRVPVSPGITGRVEVSVRAVHPRDRVKFEDLFARFGAPSVGMDVILPAPGAPLSAGGAVLEINSPCGMNYLADPEKSAARVLDSAIRHRPGFRRARGRVPVWIVDKTNIASKPGAQAKVRALFLRRFPRGKVYALDLKEGWLPILTDRTAHAFLLLVDEDTLIEHGMAAELRPKVFFVGRKIDFVRTCPILTATARNARGRIEPLKGKVNFS
jgi:hypothetical protein